MSEAKWYILHTYSGYENKVANDIKTLAENRNLQELIEDVMVPIGPATDDYGKPLLDKDGNQKEEKLFPCYVYVKMVMTDETWYICRNTRGVTGFVGPGSKPIPLTNEEVENLGVTKKASAPSVKTGDIVRIVSGVSNLIGFEGTVQSVDEEEGKVTIALMMLGRATSTTLELSAVEKVNS
ncbi:MAG: transcription termination/antitermination protein NusG [Ruminiclostridium sp.]|nr:transcription termination/antitermination protein NusG [Ruminiclostridium sp.]